MKKISNKIYKITIGIPAHNESGNIKRLLKSLIVQKLPENFELKNINVFSDASTDRTVEKAKEIEDKRIKVFNYSERMGKNFRLNQIFKNFEGDILVLFDADTLISDKFVLANLVSEFSKKKGLGFIAGNAQPLEAETLVESAINNFVYALNFMKSRINNGHNIFSVRGPIVALSKEFAGKVNLPVNVPDDRYLYLKCLQLGFSFNFAEKALVFYRSPQTLKDQINQGFRFKKDKENLYHYFEKEELDRHYFIPLYLKVLMSIYQLNKNPLAYLVMKLIHLKIVSNKNESQNHRWDMVLSSKKIV